MTDLRTYADHRQPLDRHWLANDVPQELRAFLNQNREAS